MLSLSHPVPSKFGHPPFYFPSLPLAGPLLVPEPPCRPFVARAAATNVNLQFQGCAGPVPPCPVPSEVPWSGNPHQISVQHAPGFSGVRGGVLCSSPWPRPTFSESPGKFPSPSQNPGIIGREFWEFCIIGRHRSRAHQS